MKRANALSRQDLSRAALRAAFEIRRRLEISTADPLCIFDSVERLGLEVWFVQGASFGGMFAKGIDRIFVPVERPPGRRAFTCAHELGHWYFGHGTQIDDLDFDKADHLQPAEFLVNCFAGYLLMPRAAVIASFTCRGLKPQFCDSQHIYSIASQFGVGYETFIKHLRWSLDLISHARMADLCSVPPKEIRRSFLGADICRHLAIADLTWRRVAIDLETGDIAIVPHGAKISGDAVEAIGSCTFGEKVKAVRPGLAQCRTDAGWAAMIRVSRCGFVGRAAFRHLEDPDHP